MRLLIVDDNQIQRKVLVKALEEPGLLIETAASGELALLAISTRSFDLTLLDVMMPGLSGMDVLREVRKTHSMSELPIIMATGRDSTDDVVEALSCGANDYVTKPINLPVLRMRVKTQLAIKDNAKRIHDLAVQLEARNRFILHAFGRYLTDEVVDTLLATPDGLALGGESRTVTIMMSDLRGFSSIAERLAPPQVVALLNYYFSVMTDIIIRFGGTIDEFIGDGILVIFGAPVSHADDATRAVACALTMQQAMHSVNQHFLGIGLPEIEMGIGISTGEVVVGNIGSEKRAKYGVVGPPVNLAARIESLTVGGQVLISESTREAVGEILGIDRAMDVALKGMSDSRRIFEVSGIAGPYGYRLPRRDTKLVMLPAPLALEFAVLDGVNASAALLPAQVTLVSEREVVLVTSAPIPLHNVLKLRFPEGNGGYFAEYGYGKVVGTHDSGAYRVHFTSLPPEVRRLLSKVLGNAAEISQEIASRGVIPTAPNHSTR